MSGRKVTFDVVGMPAPQGSKTRMPNGAVVEGRSTEQRARHRDWRSAVASAAREQAEKLDGPLDGPLNLNVVFRFPMPTSRPKAVRERGETWKTSAPDLDKLVRSVGDALTAGGLIVDDARICALWAEKIETIGWTGAHINVEEWT